MITGTVAYSLVVIRIYAAVPIPQSTMFCGPLDGQGETTFLPVNHNI